MRLPKAAGVIIPGEMFIIGRHVFYGGFSTAQGGSSPLTPIEYLYYLGYSVKKRQALRQRRTLPRTVISIGNITVGGTGKTPATIAVAEEALRRGYFPVILTRGYRGRQKGPCFVTAAEQAGGATPCSTVEEAGDEPVVMAARLPDVPVVKSADRHAGGRYALDMLRRSAETPMLFILDDGFQHWRLHRDLDIVLIDGLNPFGNRRLLPLGPLREPLDALKRADLFVVTKARNDEAALEARALNSAAPLFFSDYAVTGVRSRGGVSFPAETLRGEKAYAFCGIANPESFRRTLEALGVRLCGFKAYRDHHAYSTAELNSLRAEAERYGCRLLVTTEKDMVKLDRFPEPDRLRCVEISFVPDSGFFDALFSRIGQRQGGVV